LRNRVENPFPSPAKKENRGREGKETKTR